MSDFNTLSNILDFTNEKVITDAYYFFSQIIFLFKLDYIAKSSITLTPSI